MECLTKPALPSSSRQPNLADYDTAREEFRWDTASGRLTGLPAGGINICHEALERHLGTAAADKVALRWIDRAGAVHDHTYADLSRLTSRFANLLTDLGIQPQERVFALAGRIPELYIAALGSLKYRAVFCPLFSAFGPEPIQSRMQIGEAAVLVTTATLYQRKVAKIRAMLPTLREVLLVGSDEEIAALPDTRNLRQLMAQAKDRFTIEPTDPEELALLHFTSGTTGKPKGAMHVHAAVIAHRETGRIALDLHPDDIFWCTADPGWVTGTSYGIVAPLTLGCTMIVDEEEFDAQRWYRILEQQRVTVWYTAPTAIRMLMKLGDELPARHDLSRLCFMASVGEPLNSEAVVWGQETFGIPFHDNWWQSETGGIMIANYAACDVKPGSMGRPLPGIDAAVVERLNGGAVRELTEPDQQGELALKKGWPSMFRGYLNEEARYTKCFCGDWYLTGDRVRRDADGYYWFVGRADDVIKTSGHLIGPFEVEDVLMAHPAVAEAGVIGKPDPVAGEIVKAFIALKPGFTPDQELERELMAHARKRLGAVVAPKELAFRTSLPKTRSGKIMRRLLKARELGLPEGDTSTLESDT